MDATKNILIVEDDEPQRKILLDGFSLLGFVVSVASDGVEGMNMALDMHPDLITTDILMPKMSGIEMIAALRSDEWGREVPIIMLTNSEEEFQNISDSSPTYHLSKLDNSLEMIAIKIKEILSIE